MTKPFGGYLFAIAAAALFAGFIELASSPLALAHPEQLGCVLKKKNNIVLSLRRS